MDELCSKAGLLGQVALADTPGSDASAGMLIGALIVFVGIALLMRKARSAFGRIDHELRDNRALATQARNRSDILEREWTRRLDRLVSGIGVGLPGGPRSLDAAGVEAMIGRLVENGRRHRSRMIALFDDANALHTGLADRERRFNDAAERLTSAVSGMDDALRSSEDAVREAESVRAEMLQLNDSLAEQLKRREALQHRIESRLREQQLRLTTDILRAENIQLQLTDTMDHMQQLIQDLAGQTTLPTPSEVWAGAPDVLTSSR